MDGFNWDMCPKHPAAKVVDVTPDAGENFEGDSLALVKYTCKHQRFVLNLDVINWVEARDAEEKHRRELH